ncbi:phosphatidylinositol kinase [Pseudoclavibacter sp. RFBJ3]|uniref:SCO1664 family protein n=1 Tax=unclassified Pseudoclavibacter TaxID=2615177 RepID=UPI000CE8E763|nr:phosphatidylinositol kinase [Pseudoclavibacter sp. AY1H1]PPF83095.1 phosphatidylinositol kinase [Pseudoclavibacter sp. RFBJ5]PPF91794.1 phosphatidylinositol kinase [Pseudoclavibacter sp. RFBJ3]PPF95557.1 phosphatidylinositol kinase [Pseudoclavibacter sp. RFBH5]PPG19672.1 phosphatidylinositol kinase [Pseudoclavibacter sp. RFBI4]
MGASNASFVGNYTVLGEEPVEVVYKPSQGERPLWDFPNNDLAKREVAAYLVSESLGWNIVPRTWLGDGQFGPGMLQLWQDIDESQDAVDLVDASEVPDTGWRTVLTGEDETGREVVLVHEDSQTMRHMAIFDAIVNNADRKGGHVLAMADGHRYGVDHGLSFHAEPKLRTVLWGWVGEGFTGEELASVRKLRAALDDKRDSGLGARLSELLSDVELHELAARVDRLVQDGEFPAPEGDMPAAPWPLF